MSKKLSKFLSLVLRHCPEEIGVTLDRQGWADVDDLIQRTQSRFSDFTFEMLDEVVRTNDKKRFEFDVTGTKIRACQGHSVDVELDLKPLDPPDRLYHGTATYNLDSIFEQGLVKGSRNHVHLSADTETAVKVGSRHGKVVVLEVAAQQMHEDGLAFFRSTNGVWLTDYVPTKYIQFPASQKENSK